jgi:hypothetical protein
MKSMRKSLLMSAAALLIAGPAFAQGGGAAAPERAPAAQRSAPAEKIAPPSTIGQGPSKSAPDSAQVPIGSSRAADDPKGPRQSQETTGQGSREPTGQGTPSASPPVRDVTPKAESPKPDRSQTTTGQGAAGTSASLTGDQRTKISTSIKQQNVAPITNVNFSVAIGTAVPREIRRVPLPATVLEVYPAWRGYEFIMVGSDIVIIDPATLRIVAILEA